MVPMTGMEMVMEMTTKSRPKKVKHSVEWLERQLASARKDLEIAGHRIDEMSLAETRNNDALNLVLNQRDEAYNHRDESRHNCNEISYLAEVNHKSHQRTENALLASLRQLQEANLQMGKANQCNFDKSRRNADVAAVLARMAAEKDSPAEAMIKFSEAAMDMGVDLQDAYDVVRTALKRGYAAKVDDVVTAANERGMFEENLGGDEMLDDDAFQNSVEGFGTPHDFSGR